MALRAFVKDAEFQVDKGFQWDKKKRGGACIRKKYLLLAYGMDTTLESALKGRGKPNKD